MRTCVRRREIVCVCVCEVETPISMDSNDGSCLALSIYLSNSAINPCDPVRRCFRSGSVISLWVLGSGSGKIMCFFHKNKKLFNKNTFKRNTFFFIYIPFRKRFEQFFFFPFFLVLNNAILVWA